VFLNSTAALIIIAAEFVVGALLGLALAALLFRFRMGGWRALVTAVSAGTTFVVAVGLAGWACWSPSISSKYPGIANLLTNYAYPIAVVCSLAASAFVSLGSPKRR
jgi:hypothetical protein